jgi:hypothetical protein
MPHWLLASSTGSEDASKQTKNCFKSKLNFISKHLTKGNELISNQFKI